MPYPLQEIIEEYDSAAGATREYEKVKWGSQFKMMSRFHLAMQLLTFENHAKWLDVGCGTGAFQHLVHQRFPKLRCVGLDVSNELIEFARNRYESKNIEYLVADFLDYQETGFGLITSIGVLQKTNMTPSDFIMHAASLASPGGSVFIDTKHAGWKRFSEPGFFPEPDHEWFSVEEMVAATEKAGLELAAIKGFLPETGTVVDPEESHTIFLLARKDIR